MKSEVQGILGTDSYAWKSLQDKKNMAEMACEDLYKGKSLREEHCFD